MQNQTNSLPATTTTQPAGLALSKPLESWLLVERSDHVAIETIRKSAILSAEARAAMPALRDEALRPATEDQIKAVIAARFALFPQPQRNPQEWGAWWADYFDALSDLTPFAVEAGMAAWVRSPDAEFMAKPGKLRELATTVPNENRWAKAHYRAQKGATIPDMGQPEEPKVEGPRPSREEIEAVMTPFLAKMADMDPIAKAQAKRRPSPQGRVDDRGVTAEMRALLADRYGRAA